jgi:hypothetical protein
MSEGAMLSMACQKGLERCVVPSLITIYHTHHTLPSHLALTLARSRSGKRLLPNLMVNHSFSLLGWVGLSWCFTPLNSCFYVFDLSDHSVNATRGIWLLPNVVVRLVATP